MLFKAKKSEIHRRAKRLLNAFAKETRRQSLSSLQRKVIRAHYEKGFLVVKEDFVRLPSLYASDLQFQVVTSLFGILKSQLQTKRSTNLE